MLEGRFHAVGTRLRHALHDQALLSEAVNLGIEGLKAGRPDLTETLLAPIVETHPRSPVAWHVIGLAYRDQQRSAEALDALAQAARLMPADARIAAAHASVTMEAGLPSARLFAHAMQLSGGADIVLSSAAALIADNETAVAEDLLERAVTVNPAWVPGHEALASIRWTAGDRIAFARSFASATQKTADDQQLWLAWYRTFGQVKKWDEALAVLEAARGAIGPRIEFDAAEAYVATECGDDERAETLFTRTTGLNDPGTQISRVRHCIRTGRLKQAEAIATGMLEGPAASTAWPYLSVIWRLNSDARSAWLDGSPPHIGIFDLDFSVDDLSSLAGALRKLHVARDHPPEQSLRGGTQTTGSLFLSIDPIVRDARSKVLDAIRRYVAALPDSVIGHPFLGTPRQSLKFSGSWSVRLGRQGHHVTHTHPRGWISSAMYIALPPVQTMGQAPAGWLRLGTPPADLRVELPPYAEIEPRPGRLILFPSTMWHRTVPFADGERLTIACDVAVPEY